VEVIGFACRAAAHNNTGKLMPFAIQQNQILLAPVFFAASIYTTLGRVIRSTNAEKCSAIRPTLITKLFVTGDVLSLAIQAGAAGLLIAGTNPSLAQAIILIGLFLQIILFGGFIALVSIFHRRLQRDLLLDSIPPGLQWEQTLRMLYGACTLVMLRSVFRVIEFAMGADGYLLANEWPLYIFDAVPMFLLMLVFWRWFPAEFRQPKSWVPMASLNGSHQV
jgi:hypothetical protein